MPPESVCLLCLPQNSLFWLSMLKSLSVSLSCVMGFDRSLIVDNGSAIVYHCVLGYIKGRRIKPPGMVFFLLLNHLLN